MKTLIVGATSDLAIRMAHLARDRGEALFLIGRDPARLATLVDALGPRVVGHIAGDFCETGRIAGWVREAEAALGGFDSALIVHGALPDQEATESSFEEAERTLIANFNSVVAFVIPIVNTMEKAGRGSLVVVGSVAGDRGRPRNYTYGAAKGAVALYLEGVRSRLYRKGVRVVTIRLGPTHTRMTDSHKKNRLFAEKEAMAQAILEARESGPTDRYLPWFWRPIMAVVRSMPEGVFQRLSFLSGR